METKALLKLALIVAVIGIYILIILNFFIEPKKILISEIDEKNLDSWVKVSGEITSITEIEENFIIINIKEVLSQIDVTYSKQINFQVGEKIIVIGKITEYRGKLQIQAIKINAT